MNSILAVWSLSEKHSIYIKLLLQELLLLNRFFFAFAYFHFHSCHRASKVFFQKCSFSLSHFLLYILTRIIEHRKSFRKFCHSRDLDLSLIQNDRIYFITYYFPRFDDRFLIIQQKKCSKKMLDVNRICNQRRWIISLKKRLNLMFNSGFDESFFDESLDERVKILTKWVRVLHRAFNHVE